MTVRLKLLQVINVGQITGGTAACAWSVTRALPAWDHQIVCRSALQPDLVATFAPVPVVRWPQLTADRVQAAGADLVLLHNISAGNVEVPLPVPTVQYVHSRISPAPADLMVYCSHWLAERSGGRADQVLWQGVPLAWEFDVAAPRPSRPQMVIGRLCTPQAKKWPAEALARYSGWASAFPGLAWEFVGCPLERQEELRRACGGRAEFFPADWSARARFWRWNALLYHNPQVVESFGRTAAEAMRCGCIPILDAHGGFCEQIVPGTGFLCQTPDDFTAALHALQDSELRRVRSLACHRHAGRHFSLRRFAHDLTARFRQAALRAAGWANVPVANS